MGGGAGYLPPPTTLHFNLHWKNSGICWDDICYIALNIWTFLLVPVAGSMLSEHQFSGLQFTQDWNLAINKPTRKLKSFFLQTFGVCSVGVNYIERSRRWIQGSKLPKNLNISELELNGLLGLVDYIYALVMECSEPRLLIPVKGYQCCNE